MLVGKDHAGCRGLVILQRYDFCMKKHKLCTERTPMCPFATRIAADTMFFRPRSKSKGRLAQKIAHVEIAPEKKVTGGWVIYDFYYGYKIPAAI